MGIRSWILRTLWSNQVYKQVEQGPGLETPLLIAQDLLKNSSKKGKMGSADTFLIKI